MSSDERVLCPIHGFRPHPGCCAKEVDIVFDFITDSGDVVDFELFDDDDDKPAPKPKWLQKERFPRMGIAKFVSQQWPAILTNTKVRPKDYLFFEDTKSYAYVTAVQEFKYEAEGGGLTTEYEVWYDLIGLKQRPLAGEPFTIIGSQPTAPVENGGNRGE